MCMFICLVSISCRYTACNVNAVVYVCYMCEWDLQLVMLILCGYVYMCVYIICVYVCIYYMCMCVYL